MPSFKFIISSEDLAVILSSPISIACDGFKKVSPFFSFKSCFVTLLSVSSGNSSKLGLILSIFISGDEVITSAKEVLINIK